MAKKYPNFSATNVINTVSAAVNKVYNYNFPAVTESTFSNFAEQLTLAPDAVRNAWHETLVNLVGLQKVKNARRFESPFRKLRGEDIKTFDVQLLAMDLMRVKNYDPRNDSVDFFEDEPVDIEAQYLTKPLKLQTAVSLVEDELYGALVSEESFLRYIDGIEASLYNTMEMTDVINFKELIKQNIAEGNIRLETAAKPVDQTTALAFSKRLKVLVNDLKAEMAADYNLSHMYTITPDGEGILITDNETGATMDTYALAWAFNKSFVELTENGQGINVKSDSFGDVYALYADREFFEIHNILGFPKTAQQYFGNSLQLKRWLHYWTLYAVSFFSNAIAFIPPASIGITAATLDTPDTIKAFNKGTYGKAIVKTITTASGKYGDKYGTFSISGNNSTKTVIDPVSGKFEIGEDETATSLTVTWTSHLDNTVTANMTLTINQ